MTNEYKLSYTATQIDQKLGKIDNLATKSEVPSKTSDLTNDSGFITGYTETDPTVPDWAKKQTKPTYTASEVGADASGTASSLINTHNTATDSHSDIREAINNKLNSSELSSAINTALNQAKESGEFDGTSVTVSNVSESTADGGSNVVTFSDGTQLTVKNGTQGTPGYTPQKNVDYWTPADQESIVQQVIAALGTPVFGRVEDGNKIVLTGNVANGTYEYWYEDENGKQAKIGTLEHGTDEAAYTNMIPLSTEADGVTLYNDGKGYKENTRHSSSSGGDASATGITVSGYIAVSDGDVIRLKNITMNQNSTVSNSCHVWYATADAPDGANIDFRDASACEKFNPVWDNDGNLVQFTIPAWGVTRIRLNTAYIGDDSIVTINEEIPE